jgi:hypothetical protein
MWLVELHLVTMVCGWSPTMYLAGNCSLVATTIKARNQFFMPPMGAPTQPIPTQPNHEQSRKK